MSFRILDPAATLALLDAGERPSVIAKAAGVTPQAVRRIALLAGRPPRRRGSPPGSRADRTAMIAALARDPTPSFSDLGREFGMTREGARRAVLVLRREGRVPPAPDPATTRPVTPTSRRGMALLARLVALAARDGVEPEEILARQG